jgi:hypothetical protein
MLMVVALYTICTLNDKYAVSKAKYNGAELTFLMAAGTAAFMLFILPFSDLTFTLSPMSFIFIVLIALSKYLEFSMSAKILTDMSAFELKAWLGLLLFASYFTDIAMDKDSISLLKLLFIALTAVGLVLIAQSGKQKVNYLKIAVPLVVYLAAKFSYGFIMTSAEKYISSTLTLFFALILLALVLLPAAKPHRIPKNSPEGMKGMLIVLLCKLPNTAGLLGENAVAAQSLTNYSFIQPMILIVLFVMALFSKTEKLSRLSLAGSIAVIAGIMGFQIV